MMPWPGLVEPFTECLGLGLLGSLAAGYLLDASFLLTLFFMVMTAEGLTATDEGPAKLEGSFFKTHSCNSKEK